MILSVRITEGIEWCIFNLNIHVNKEFKVKFIRYCLIKYADEISVKLI